MKNIDVLFKGLIRSPKILGVHMGLAFILILVYLITALLFENFLIMLVGVINFVWCKIKIAKDENFFSLYMLKLKYIAYRYNGKNIISHTKYGKRK